MLFLLSVAPFYAYKVRWLMRSKPATGVGWFVGNTLELNGSISEHLVIRFATGRGSFYFNAGMN
ncbi:MAG TPA: hypothetical protein VL978_14760 [Puia sp.]|nr:hypothetical protein [Puia sp.]